MFSLIQQGFWNKKTELEDNLEQIKDILQLNSNIPKLEAVFLLSKEEKKKIDEDKKSSPPPEKMAIRIFENELQKGNQNSSHQKIKAVLQQMVFHIQRKNTNTLETYCEKLKNNQPLVEELPAVNAALCDIVRNMSFFANESNIKSLKSLSRWEQENWQEFKTFTMENVLPPSKMLKAWCAKNGGFAKALAKLDPSPSKKKSSAATELLQSYLGTSHKENHEEALASPLEQRSEWCMNETRGGYQQFCLSEKQISEKEAEQLTDAAEFHSFKL